MGIHTEVHDNKKAPRNQGLQHPAILNEPLSLLVYPAPAASSSCLRTFRIRRQKAPFMRKNLSQSELNEPPPLLVINDL
ncbi:hypothetical protein COK20_18500 [Bacillus cereus]|nr:hypothetical protein COK20_18500 [Bacillus cereus]